MKYDFVTIPLMPRVEMINAQKLDYKIKNIMIKYGKNTSMKIYRGNGKMC